jgi:hypothetical protein
LNANILTEELAGGFNRLTTFGLGGDNLDASDEAVSLGKT